MTVGAGVAAARCVTFVGFAPMACLAAGVPVALAVGRRWESLLVSSAGAGFFPSGADMERRITEAGGEAVYVHLDVTSDEDWAAAVDTAVARFGKLDVLVNNAGIANDEKIEETSEELWERIMLVNAKGVFLGTRKALPAMRRAGGGSIINVSSIAGIPGRALTGSAYSASKGAVRTFTKTTAIQHASERMRCNSIHPGLVDTPMLAGISNNLDVLAARIEEVPPRLFAGHRLWRSLPSVCRIGSDHSHRADNGRRDYGEIAGDGKN